MPAGAAGVPESQDRLATTLAEITVRLVDDHVVDTVLRLVTGACADLPGAAAIGVLVVDPRGGPQVLSASDDRSRFVELLQAQTDQGPCVECVHDGSPVHSADLRQDARRWPEFVPEAVAVGFLAVHAIPLRLVGRAVNGLNLLYDTPRTFELPEVRLAEVLADLTVLGLSQERDPRTCWWSARSRRWTTGCCWTTPPVWSRARSPWTPTWPGPRSATTRAARGARCTRSPAP